MVVSSSTSLLHEHLRVFQRVFEFLLRAFSDVVFQNSVPMLRNYFLNVKAFRFEPFDKGCIHDTIGEFGSTKLRWILGAVPDSVSPFAKRDLVFSWLATVRRQLWTRSNNWLD